MSARATPDARQRWFLKGFFKESDPMLVSFEYLPCRVRFAEDPSELVFDYRLPIRSNIDHILGDEENLTRIPASLMGEGNSLLLRRAFEGAVVEAARRAAANYTLAVPQFYGGRIQLLLPLCLTGDDISEVTFENFGKEVRLYLWERNAA